MDKVRVGIIGAGRISDLHAIEYLSNPRAEITAVCDLNFDLARHQASRWNVPQSRVFRDYAQLLACDAINLVEILLPHDLHAEVSIAAARAGKHVSVQKPMAISLIDADRMITATAECGVSLRVFENAIFYPPIQKAKSLVEAGAIGEPLSIRIKANKGDPRNAWPVPSSARAWRQDPARSGGGPMSFDDGHHKFAVAWHFMGLAEEVHAWIDSTEIEPGNYLDCPAMITWKFPDKRYGNLEIVYSPELRVMTEHYAQHDPVEITGTKGVIRVTRGHGRISDEPPVVLYTDMKVQSFSNMSSGWEASFVEATRHHINALLEGATPTLTGEEGRDILRFCLAGQRSAKLGRSVKLKEI